MCKITQSLIYLALLVVSATSHAVSLQSGDVLHFTSGSFVEGLWGYNAAGGPFYDSATLTELNGLIIGTTAQPGIPGIDQTWTSASFGISGNHRTTAAVTVIDGTTLDFSGWVMILSGSEDYSLGTQQNIANYTFDGTNFTLDYYWDLSDNGNNPLGSLEVSNYHLHLEGTVSHVPIPAAAWLFGSGLLGLVGMARRKRTA